MIDVFPCPLHNFPEARLFDVYADFFFTVPVLKPFTDLNLCVMARKGVTRGHTPQGLSRSNFSLPSPVPFCLSLGSPVMAPSEQEAEEVVDSPLRNLFATPPTSNLLLSMPLPWTRFEWSLNGWPEGLKSPWEGGLESSTNSNHHHPGIRPKNPI